MVVYSIGTDNREASYSIQRTHCRRLHTEITRSISSRTYSYSSTTRTDMRMNHSIDWRPYASQATTDRTPKAMPCKSLLSTQF